MNIFSGYKGALHHIRVKLYQNYLPKVDEPYFARTDNDTFLTIEQVCETMKKRADSAGKYEHMVEIVKQFFDEVVFQLCDGFGVNLIYFSVYPKISGTFKSIRDPRNVKKNPVKFKFLVRNALRELAQHIIVDIVGFADTNGFIHQFTDVDEESINGLTVPGNMFTITGDKLKLTEKNPNCGVFFVSADDPSKEVKVERIAENTPTKIIGIVPKTDFPNVRIEIRTLYNGTKKGTLKNMRVIKSDFTLEAA